MDQTIQNYSNFFNDQINEMVSDYRHVLRAPIKQLLANDGAFAVTVHGVSEDHGHVIFKFDKHHAPRLKVQKSFVLVKRAARERWGYSPYHWGCSFEEFLSKDEFHTSSSFALPLYFMKGGDEDSLLVGCGGVSSRMFRKLKSALADGIQVHAIVYDVEPPTRYLANLVDYMARNDDDRVLLTRPHMKYDDWRPALLAFDKNDEREMSRKLLDSLAKQKCVVLQGPPGTGKSYCAAQVIADYLSRGQSVCVTAMANKALMELISQPPLEKYLKDRRLAKTMLTSDEAVAARGLEDADSDYVVPKGNALFATYYKISNQFRRIEGRESPPLFDLIVIEEASQAYLTTIAAILRLTKECLIVGDPMQLSPIVLSEGKPEYKQWNAMTQSEGLSTFVLGTEVKSFRITTTFRLPPATAELTGIFYGNMLKSVSPKREGWQGLSGRYFPSAGGVVYEIMEGGEDGVLSSAAVGVMRDVLAAIEKCRPSSTVAIITPFKDSAKAIQSRFSFAEGKIDVSVETIDRVQGATVDYAIIYFPLRNAGFALNDRRFNVATSRSRTTTLILSDFDLLAMRSITGKVREFLEKVVGVKRNDTKGIVTKPISANTNVQMIQSFGLADGMMPTLENVQKLLEQTQVFFASWLKDNLVKVYPQGYWQRGVIEAVNDTQREDIFDNGCKELEDLDFASLVSVFLYPNNIRSFRRIVHIGQEASDLAKHVKKIRNLYAHKNTRTIVSPDAKEIKYHMDTLEMFWKVLNTNEKEIRSISVPRPAVSPGHATVTIKRGGITITAK